MLLCSISNQWNVSRKTCVHKNTPLMLNNKFYNLKNKKISRESTGNRVRCFARVLARVRLASDFKPWVYMLTLHIFLDFSKLRSSQGLKLGDLIFILGTPFYEKMFFKIFTLSPWQRKCRWELKIFF